MVTQFEVTTAIVKNWGKFDLRESSKVLLATLSTHLPCIRVSDKTLIQESGLSETTFYRALRELVDKSFILKEKREIIIQIEGVIFQNERVVPFKMKGSCHEQTIRTKKNKVFNFENEGIRPISARNTKRILEEKSKVKRGSPLDLPMESAADMLKYLPPNSFFAKEIRKKWNL